MPGKEATVFNTFFNIAVSGSASASAATFTSSVTANIYRDNVGYQINYTGAPQGVLQINACNDYSPMLPQSATPQNASATGTWTTLTSVSMANVVSPVLFNLNQIPFAFIQCQFISATSSGVITGWIATKSLGS